MLTWKRRRYPLHLWLCMKDGDGDGGGGGGNNETWHTKLPDDLKADPSLIDFKDEENMVLMPVNVARSYVNTKKLVGRDKIPMPKTDEEWADTYNRLGRPEAASHYNLEMDGAPEKLKEALTKNAEAFRGEAHKIGLSDKQANGLWKFYMTQSADALGDLDANVENAMREAETELRTTYGNSFEGKMVLMNRGIDELDHRVGGGFKELVTNAALSRNASFVKALVTVGEMMAEDLGLDKDTGGPATSMESLDEQIGSIQRSIVYTDAGDPGHAVAVEKVAKLMQQKFGRKPVDTLTRQSFVT